MLYAYSGDSPVLYMWPSVWVSSWLFSSSETVSEHLNVLYMETSQGACREVARCSKCRVGGAQSSIHVSEGSFLPVCHWRHNCNQSDLKQGAALRDSSCWSQLFVLLLLPWWLTTLSFIRGLIVAVGRHWWWLLFPLRSLRGLTAD